MQIVLLGIHIFIVDSYSSIGHKGLAPSSPVLLPAAHAVPQESLQWRHTAAAGQTAVMGEREETHFT